MRLVERGDPARSLPACNSCHGSTRAGRSRRRRCRTRTGNTSRVRLRAFKDDSRRNDIYTRMRSVADKLTDREIERLANFYATTLSY